MLKRTQITGIILRRGGFNRESVAVYYPVNERQKIPVIPVIVGATASGKSALARELADFAGGGIISVDSRKIYRRLNIGTAKPSVEIIQQYNYGMIDLIEPHEKYSAYQYAQKAVELITKTITSGKQPVLIGGTGLYLRALKDGIFIGPEADENVRAEIAEEAAEIGWAAMHEKLRQVDPEAATKIDPGNIPRLQRALEVYRLTGSPITSWQREGRYEKPPWQFLLFGINRSRTELHDRIARRTDKMVNQGLFAEVESLLAMGIKPTAPGFRTVGYREVIDFLAGQLTRNQAVEKIKISTRQYAKRQLTWFRHQETVHWLTPSTNMSTEVLKHLAQTG